MARTVEGAVSLTQRNTLANVHSAIAAAKAAFQSSCLLDEQLLGRMTDELIDMRRSNAEFFHSVTSNRTAAPAAKEGAGASSPDVVPTNVAQTGSIVVGALNLAERL